MDIKRLQKLVIDALEDVKAQDIKLFDTTHLTSLFDRIAVASGTSNRQTKALAASVRDKVKEAGGTILSMEGENTGEWVLVDLGDIVVHIMQPTIRAYYHLEDIWGDKPLNLTAVKRKKSAKSAAASERKATSDAPKKPAPRKTASKTTASSKTSKAPTKKTVTSKSPAKKTVSVKSKTASKTAAKTVPVKRVAAKKTAAAKTTKASTSKPKVAAKKTAIKKTAAKKTTAKKPSTSKKTAK